MKLAIIGSRTCPAIDLDKIIATRPDTIVSGGARGADTLARAYAIHHNIPLEEYLPDYDLFPDDPKRAPLERNKTIVANCDRLLALWDGSSRGTAFTINLASQAGKPVQIYYYKTGQVKFL